MIGSVRAPDAIGEGKVKVTLSCPNWKEGKVVPVTIEVPVQKRNQ
jgi:hypothetical protein